MFLIEVIKDEYIDAETINWISLTNEMVRFTCAGESGNTYHVDKNLESSFLNNLQALNSGFANPEARHRHIINPATKSKVNKQ